jgi:hypothetical protein
MVEELRREDFQEEARFDATHGRYLSLAAAIKTPPSMGEEPVPYAWIAEALRASAPRVDDLLAAPQVRTHKMEEQCNEMRHLLMPEPASDAAPVVAVPGLAPSPS